MKILMTGGGSGGHFYPIIAVAQAIQDIARKEKILEPRLYFAGPTPYDKKELFDNNIKYVQIAAGKRRKYRSIFNFFDLFKTGWGIAKAIVRILFIFPDVIFGKGGYGSFPTLVAARILGIPVILHESDTIPGRVNLWAAKFAKKIAISFPEAEDYFKLKPKEEEKIAFVGNPVRKGLMTIAPEGAREYLKLEPGTPTILILGGSQGAKIINEAVVEALPVLLEKYHVIHQTGGKLFDEVTGSVNVLLGDSNLKSRYKPFPFLDLLAMRMAAGAADVIISRAGANSIFEIATWGKPSIIIPIPTDVSRDQQTNAFAYAGTGSAVVIEQNNLTPHLLASEIERLITDTELRARMSESAKNFARPGAAEKIGREILNMALEHER